jgi:hypothetical protein
VQVLQDIPGEAALNVLMDACMGSQTLLMHRAACQGLAKRDETQLKPLLDALHQRDLNTIATTYDFYIAWGEPGSEPVLIQTLEQYGDDFMATSFLNSGNDKLVKAAEEWAEENGYTITSIYTPGSSGSWGSR